MYMLREELRRQILLVTPAMSQMTQEDILDAIEGVVSAYVESSQQSAVASPVTQSEIQYLAWWESKLKTA